MRAAFDTNVLVYAEGLNDAGRMASAHALLARLPARSIVIPIQVLGELTRVMRRKANLSADEVLERVGMWATSYDTLDTSAAVFDEALTLSMRHHVDIWDALVLSAAAASGCALLLSEDFQDGFVWKGCTVANPFLAKQHPLLVSLLSGGS